MKIACILITWLALSHAVCGQMNLMTATNVLENMGRLFGHGLKISPLRVSANSFPITRIGGENQDKEMFNYAMNVHSKKEMPETKPALEDTNGHWGTLADGMQASVRFRQDSFERGVNVPVWLILRNDSDVNREWWRNGFPDCGYHFHLTRGTNEWSWSRPQQERRKHTLNLNESYSGPDDFEHRGDDPFWYVSEPKTEDLTILYLNRFFDLSQPGEYSLRVQIAVPLSDGKGETNVVFGTAKFEILPAH